MLAKKKDIAWGCPHIYISLYPLFFNYIL